MCRTAGKDAAGQRVLRAVENRERFVEIAGADHREYGAENLFLGQSRLWRNIGEDVWTDKKALLGEWADVDSQKLAGLATADVDVLADSRLSFRVDQRPDAGGRIFGQADLQA